MADTRAASLSAGAHALPATSRANLYSIERTVLQTRIAALEQALEAKEQEQTEIIDQYETILSQRAADDAAAIEFDDTQDASLLDDLYALFKRQ